MVSHPCNLPLRDDRRILTRNFVGLRPVNRRTRRTRRKTNSAVSTPVPQFANCSSPIVSRVMIHLFSRLVRLLSRLSRSKVRITELDSPGDVTLAPEPKAETPDSTSAHATAASPGKKGQSAEEILIKEARSLNDDVDAWISSLQLRTLEHERVQVGNRAYAYTMKVRTICWLSGVLLNYPADPPPQTCIRLWEGRSKGTRRRQRGIEALLRVHSCPRNVHRVSVQAISIL